ncbi:MAG: hypothetical protein JWM11_3033 [Planctomycetaceae bacterium]|nr:hypothetical protein [Planctomycetaceae bacterium]
MNDSFREVSSESWFSRLAGAFFGMIFGVILFGVAFPVIIWNEGRAVHRAQDLDEGQSLAVEVDSAKVDPNQEGKLVFTNSQATTDETLQDPLFGLSAEHAIRLARKVAMYQWVEKKESKKVKKLGGSEVTETTYSYSQDWDKDLNDSSRFKHPEEHTNPTQKPFPDFSKQADKVTVGVFEVPHDLIGSLNQTEPVSVTDKDLEKVPAEQREKLKVVAGEFYRGESPGTPAIGDVKVSFEKVPPVDCTLMGVQTGNTFAPYKTRGDRTLFELRSGTHTKEQLFGELTQENNFLTWVLRIVGFGLMFFGLMLLFKPLSVFGSVLPFLGDLLEYGMGAFAFLIALACALITIAIGWIFYRPVWGVSLLAGGLLLIYLLSRAGHSRRPALPPIPQS